MGPHWEAHSLWSTQALILTPGGDMTACVFQQSLAACGEELVERQGGKQKDELGGVLAQRAATKMGLKVQGLY